MIKQILFLFALALFSHAEELKVISENFKADQSKGIAVFSGNVKISKGLDEINASKVTIYTDKEKKPVKYTAEGDVSFSITTEENELYHGKAQTVIYIPAEREYRFYTKVDLIRMDDYRRVKGDKVILNTVHGQASAQSTKDEPVMMIFTLEDKNPKPKSPSK